MGGIAYKALDEHVLGPGFPLQGSVVKSTRRTIELFEFFAEYQRPASPAQVAHALGYPPSSTVALLRSLVRMGYLEYDRQSRRYFPTLRISLLGGWIEEKYFHDNDVLPLMRTLAGKTQANIVVAMQNGIFAQYLLVIDGGDTMRAYARTRSLRPICRSATGRMLLTLKSDDEVRGIAAHSNAVESEPETRVKLSELMADLDVCRRRGYAITNGTATPGRGVVAMLLPTLPGHLPLAIGIGGPSGDLDRKGEAWIALMREQLAIYRVSNPSAAP